VLAEAGHLRHAVAEGDLQKRPPSGKGGVGDLPDPAGGAVSEEYRTDAVTPWIKNPTVGRCGPPSRQIIDPVDVEGHLGVDLLKADGGDVSLGMAVKSGQVSLLNIFCGCSPWTLEAPDRDRLRAAAEDVFHQKRQRRDVVMWLWRGGCPGSELILQVQPARQRSRVEGRGAVENETRHAMDRAFAAVRATMRMFIIPPNALGRGQR